jgi:phage terminase small subunit
MKTMNIRHQAFANEYLSNGLNAMGAYKTVYKCSDRVAQSNGIKLLENTRIKEFIEEKRQKTAEKLDISREEVLKRFIRIATTNEGSDDRTAISALQEINKMQGYLAPAKSDINLKGYNFTSNLDD